MNPGGDRDRDDFGLPPADIEIPDDARELDRDVQAYYREQRALRRHLRRQRWAGPLARDGMVLPLLAGCLVLALIAGTLLTVFTAEPGDLTSGQHTQPAGGLPSASMTEGSSSPAPATSVTVLTGPRSQLPAATIEISSGPLRRPLRLWTVRDSVLTLVPAGCGCAGAVRQLIMQAVRAGVPIYLVGTDGGMAGVRHLAKAADAAAVVVDDVHNVLGRRYRPAGPTALLVDRRGHVRTAKLPPRPRLTSALLHLAAASPAAP